MAEHEVTPERLLIESGGSSRIVWRSTANLADAIHWANRDHQTGLPAEPALGYVLVALGVDETFDEVVVSPGPMTRDRADLAEMLLSARDILDESGIVVDKIMTGREITPITDLVWRLNSLAEQVKRCESMISTLDGDPEPNDEIRTEAEWWRGCLRGLQIALGTAKPVTD